MPAKKILVVEDEGVVAMDLTRQLGSFGYSIAGVASNAEDAVEMASTRSPDLVLMDIRLRGERDGIDAATELRRLDIPVIFLSAYADRDTLQRARLAEPYGYVVKPFATVEIRASIETAINKHQNDRRLRRSEAWLAATLRGELEKKAIESHNRETADIMLAGLTHDFNNLLAIILSQADLLQSDSFRKSEESQEILHAASMAVLLGRQLVAMGKRDDGALAAIDLNHTVTLSAGMLKGLLLKSSCHLSLELDPAPVTVSSNPVGIQRLLLNLVVNARDAMPEGGQIAILTSRTASGEGRLTVSDNGIGMDAETLARIFDPFFSRKGNKNRGLGLTIVRDVIAESGGTIQVESEPGRGSQFIITFPAGNFIRIAATP